MRRVAIPRFLVVLLAALIVLLPAFVTASAAPRAVAAQLVAADPGVGALATIRKYGSALADEGKVGAWDCGTAWVVGSRWGDMTADNDALGGSIKPPKGLEDEDGYVATIASFVTQRYYKLTLYAPSNAARGRVGGDLVIEMPYDAMTIEQGTVFPTGRYDPLGQPSLFFAQNLLRFNQAGFTGSGSVGPGYRIYAQCSIIPPPRASGYGSAIELREHAPGRWAL